MTLYLTSTAGVTTYSHAVRAYATLPLNWDGYQYNDGKYHQLNRDFLIQLGVTQLPAQGSKTVIMISVKVDLRQPMVAYGDTVAAI